MNMAETIDASGGIDHEHLHKTGRLSAGLHHKAGEHSAGRDLTDFGSRQNFERVLADLDLPSEPVELYDEDGRRRMFVWVNADLMLVAGANPITGEHAHYDRQEVGYASYIGLEGRHKAVEGAMDRIERAMSEHPDAFTDGRTERGSRGFI